MQEIRFLHRLSILADNRRTACAEGWMLFIFADCVAVSPAALTLFTVRFGNGDFQSFGLGCGLGNCSLFQHNLADD